MMRTLLLCITLVLPWLAKANIVVLTSFPEDFYSKIADTYHQRFPDSSLRFLNKKTPALIAHLMQGRQPQPDLVWVSSSDAMALLQQLGFIEPPITFAWSEFGFFWHQQALKLNSLPKPTSWKSLLEPQLAGKIAISAPSRSGTNHLVVELILQQYGWSEGWKVITQLGGNLATITARSFGVRQGIVQQRFVMAPVVDFFYKHALADGYDVGFVALPYAPLIPAQIAHVTGKHSDGGQKFIDFLLSQRGQALVSSPQLNRISLHNGRQRQNQTSHFDFDQSLSASRYHLVNRLFDVVITERLAELQKFWQLWHHIGSQSLTESERKQLKQILNEVSQVPVDSSVATDPKLNEQLNPINRYESFSKRLTRSWQASLNKTLLTATNKLESLSQEVELRESQ